MGITVENVETLSPDQGSLTAASKLVKSGKWPVLGEAKSAGLIWGECQGSGANPYRVAVNTADLGYKCTCPSRKFPCKHSLALMWMYAESVKPFEPAPSAPDWVMDWTARRRSAGTVPDVSGTSGQKKSISEAQTVDEVVVDPKSEARRAAAAKKQAENTENAITAATLDLELWIDDKLRTGLSGLLSDMSTECRKIAARMVDGKAAALASRIDELPSRILSKPAQMRSDVLITELSKLVLLCRAWRSDPTNPDVRRSLGTGEKREDILGNPDNLKVSGEWEVLGERIRTRKDGLVSHSTWLLNLGADGPDFALLLDFFPASAGKRAAAFTSGDQFRAELVYYPSTAPLRALISSREATHSQSAPWPTSSTHHLSAHSKRLQHEPWALSSPLYLSRSVVREDEGGLQWLVDEDDRALPLAQSAPAWLLGAPLHYAAGLWDGTSFDMIAVQSSLGRVSFDG